MGTPDRIVLARQRAALSGFAASVVFTLAAGAAQHDWAAGLSTGAAVGVGVFAAHWFSAQPRR